MPYTNPLQHIAFSQLLDTLVPDFVLSSVFFTALIYTVLGQRFSRQRAAAVASLAIGLALSTGIVWWEAAHGYSIRDLGPLGVGFAILLLASVMYRALRDIGGRFSGIMLTLGASVLIGWLMGLHVPLEPPITETMALVALSAGFLSLAYHRRHTHGWFPQAQRSISAARNDRKDLHLQRRVSGRLTEGFRQLKRQSEDLVEHPEARADVMLQLERMLPAEGYLTERLARLRERAYRMRHGHVARIVEIRHVISGLPPEAKQRLARQLAAQYAELRLNLRLERLDKACAETERRIGVLTQEARAHLARHDCRRLTGILERAAKLQSHNTRLFHIIDRTEKKLIHVAKKIAKQAQGVSPA